jgi:hypothetical protein
MPDMQLRRKLKGSGAATLAGVTLTVSRSHSEGTLRRRNWIVVPADVAGAVKLK